MRTFVDEQLFEYIYEYNLRGLYPEPSYFGNNVWNMWFAQCKRICYYNHIAGSLENPCKECKYRFRCYTTR